MQETSQSASELPHFIVHKRYITDHAIHTSTVSMSRDLGALLIDFSPHIINSWKLEFLKIQDGGMPPF